MQLTFGRGSNVVAEVSSWEMWYPWPPFHQVYENEPGLWFHLSPADASDIVSAISSAVGTAAGALGGPLAAFLAVVPQLLGHLVQNPDGSMDIHVAPHGFQVGNAPAADPNAWINGAWAPVAAALWHLPVRQRTLSVQQSSGLEMPSPELSSRGRMIRNESLTTAL
jgi:hypothetical protein